MEIFEYLMVMVAIILGIGVTQALRGLSKIACGSKPFVAVTIWGVDVVLSSYSGLVGPVGPIGRRDMESSILLLCSVDTVRTVCCNRIAPAAWK